MLQPPPLKDLPRYPVTASIGLAAIAATLAWWTHWSGWDMPEILGTSERVWARWELWRALTSTLLHVNFFHLAFNLYWFWVFGTLVERVYGHLQFAGIVVLLALGSSLAEFALLNGGVGLSGVGYGLWGMLWVLEKRDPRFHDAVDRQTTQLFIVWFFLCVVLTLTDIMPVANIAHAVGAGLGVLLGLAASSRGPARLRPAAALGAIELLCLAGATVLWPAVNFTNYKESGVERAGLDALERKEFKRGVRLLEIAAHMRNAPARAWYNLGVGYQRANRFSDAANAFQRAADMADATSDMREAARASRVWRTAKGTDQEPEK
jgi:membrane associated rhomboid family serine protease